MNSSLPCSYEWITLLAFLGLVLGRHDDDNEIILFQIIGGGECPCRTVVALIDAHNGIDSVRGPQC